DRWLDGRTFDAVMNYRFAEPVVAWVGNIERKISVTELDRQLLELRLAYPAEVSFALMNLVDSHDTDRIASMLLNPDRPFDRSNEIQRADDYDCGRPHPIHFARQRLIALLQMTYVGAPMIYYGDEVGMWGADDPTNRQPMVWRDLEPYDRPDEVFFDEAHFAVYRELVALRRAHVALRLGSFRTVIADDAQDLWVFERVHGTDSVLVAVTPSEAGARFELPEPPDGRRWVSVLGDESQDHGASVRVPGLFGRAWSSRA
ncbi:MAG: alpha-amylase family glycosyl hydrolase, partial [Planctomycetota bacterium]|nr:alpha-amylase family glycosyl hydrolase [Planctomycetota bacterium]